MSFLDLSRDRYSVRSFSDRPLEEDKLAKILEAGRLAPTACNRQPQKIFVIRSEKALATLRSVTEMTYHAPVVLLVCYDAERSYRGSAYGDPFDSGMMDASIVTTAMMMEATELGVGTLWARGFSAKAIADAFALPETIRPVCLLDLGYPTPDCRPAGLHTDRRPLSETVTEL